jgi:hypothetical protein
MDIDVVVIGAGAAGMMCAAQAGTRGRRVLLVDHWPTIGERIRISGGGRCNFTNRHVSADHFLSRNPHFCRSALARFSSRDFLAMVERHGVAYHERDHGQLFCDRTSQDLVDLLRDECAEAGVQWAYPCAVERVERAARAGAAERGTGPARFAVSTDRGTFTCESVVIATGGLAVPLLGATPFGYAIADQLGLRVVPPKPALVPLALAPDSLSAMAPLAGVAFAAETGCAAPGAPRFRENVLITHRGLSGPAVLQISSYWQAQEFAGASRKPIVIDLLPGIDAGGWLGERRDSHALLANLLSESLPRRFAHEWCAIHDWKKPLNQCSAAERRDVAQALNAWTLMPSGTLGFAKAEVTLGGVDTGGLSSQTMEATAVPGLFFIGEVVDVTGWLGGYNFQWAWSSGWVAGQFV